MTKKTQTKTKKVDEKALEGLREDFIKSVPQLEEVEQVRQKHEEILEREGRKIYPYIDTQSFSTTNLPSRLS